MQSGLTRLAVLGLCLHTLLSGADDPFAGTWILNTENSVLEGAASVGRRAVLTYELDGAGNLLMKLDHFWGTRPISLERLARYSGCETQERPVVVHGNPSAPDSGVPIPPGRKGWSVAISCSGMNDEGQVLVTRFRRDGMLVASSDATLWPGGQNLTIVATGVTEKGEYYRAELIWDRQP
jgi:hypothetical protein